VSYYDVEGKQQFFNISKVGFEGNVLRFESRYHDMVFAQGVNTLELDTLRVDESMVLMPKCSYTIKRN
jgi:hypothetical protein